MAAEDDRRLRASGIAAARDGLRWHLIEASPGRDDWSGTRPMSTLARFDRVPVRKGDAPSRTASPTSRAGGTGPSRP